MMYQILLNNKIYRSWIGPCPGVEDELRKAKDNIDGFSYHQVADGEYTEGEDINNFDITTGQRIANFPPEPDRTKDGYIAELNEINSWFKANDYKTIKAMQYELSDGLYGDPLSNEFLIECQSKRDRYNELEQLINSTGA